MTGLPGRLVLLGHPVAHSLSPRFQNAALEAAGIPLRYEALDVAPSALAETLHAARAGEWAGNVTIPHKEDVFSACSELSPVAKRAGAVNVFRARNGAIAGHNTDVDGVRAAIAALLERDPADLTFGIVGAGGSAAAVLTAIEGWRGCTAIVANRGVDRRRALVERFSSVAREGDAGEIARHADVVVNATSLGLLSGDQLPLDPGTLGRHCAVLDLVYAPGKTRLVRESQDRGLRSDDGLRMLVAQGAAAFAWWFGVAPDHDVMWQAVTREAG